MTDDDPSYQESDGCQVGGGPAARAVAGPVDPLDTDAAKRRVTYLLLIEAPYSVQLARLARWVFGDHVESGDADWKWVRRECERQGHQVEQYGETWVSPQFDRGQSVLDTASGISQHRGLSGSVASANAAARVGCRRVLGSAGEWGVLVGALGGKRVGEDAGEGRATRFNSVSRALGSVDRVAVAFEGAVAAGFGDGVVVTATTDPERFESVGDAAGSLLDDVGLLRRKFGRPPGVTVVEPTARGVGHAHVALFDVARRDLPSLHELHRYWWETRERGQQVDVQSIEFDGESWTWAGDAPGDAAGCPPRAYLGEGPESLVATARLDADDVLSVARAFRRRGEVSVSPESVDALDAAVSAETGVDAGSVRRAAWHFGTGVKAATRPSRVLRTAAGTGEGSA